MSSEDENTNVKVNDAVEKALNEVLSSRGQMLTGFIGVITLLDAEGGKRFMFYSGDGQSPLTELGMADALQIDTRGRVMDILDRNKP